MTAPPGFPKEASMQDYCVASSSLLGVHQVLLEAIHLHGQQWTGKQASGLVIDCFACRYSGEPCSSWKKEEK